MIASKTGKFADSSRKIAESKTVCGIHKLIYIHYTISITLAEFL